MSDSRNGVQRQPAGSWYPVWLLAILSAGCQTVGHESAYVTGQSAAEQASISMSASELRMRLDDLANVFSGSIEQAADRVIAETTDPAVEQSALLWKINAIPMAYRALFHSDPGIALIDTWVLSGQMVAYFEVGAGRDDLQELHFIALDACRRLETTVAGIVRQTRKDGDIERFQAGRDKWVAEHPIQRDFAFRDTAIPELSSKLGRQKLGAVQTVGNLALRVEDIAFRLFLYMDLVTRQSRWQVEFAMADKEKDAGIQSALGSLDDMVAAVNRITAVVEEAPELVAAEKETMLTAMRQERVAALEDIDQQRIETLAYLTRERTAAIDDLVAVQEAITEIVQVERETVLESIEAQRVALMVDIEDVGLRIAEDSILQSRRVVDHFFLRALQFSGLLLLLCGVVATVIHYRSRRKHAGSQ